MPSGPPSWYDVMGSPGPPPRPPGPMRTHAPRWLLIAAVILGVVGIVVAAAGNARLGRDILFAGMNAALLAGLVWFVNRLAQRRSSSRGGPGEPGP